MAQKPADHSPALGYTQLIIGNLAAVLRVAFAYRADRADAHSIEVGARFRRVTLKIAVQRAIALRNGKFVTRLREMIHADVVISGIQKAIEPGAKDSEFF